MFIIQKRHKTFWVVEVLDDKNLLLHYFEKELESLHLQSPVLVLINVNENDRRGYKIKLVKLFKKINRLASYHVIIGNTDFLVRSTKEILK